MTMPITNSTPFYPADTRFIESLRAFLKNYRRGGWLTIHGAAELAGVSVRTLQRRLADEGWVFSDLVSQVRVDVATQMLSETDATVSEIATHLGYSNQANFSRAFQRWTGKSPAKFRRESVAGDNKMTSDRSDSNDSSGVLVGAGPGAGHECIL